MTSEQKHIVLYHSKLPLTEPPLNETVTLLQRAFKKFENELTIIPLDECTDEQRASVTGMIQITKRLPSADHLDLFPNLRVIATLGTGVDHINVQAATERGIKVGNSRNEVVDSTVDLAFALLLSAARKIVLADRKYRNPKDGDALSNFGSLFGQDVTGSTLGIVGLGSIGAEIAQRAKAFRMRTVYYSRTRKQHLEQEIGVAYCESLKDLLQQADFVILSACYTQETHHMIGATEFSYMKPTSILINIARGGLINQDDLVTALTTGQIYGAALDVTTPEPLPRDHPLLALPNVIITPHIGTATAKARISMIDKMMKNLMAGVRGEPLPSPVN